MAFEETNGVGTTMLVSPTSQNGGFGFGGDWAWIIILLLVFGGGWGMGGFGGFGGGMDIYPWLNNSQNINGGFRDQMLNTSIASIGDKVASGFGDVQTSLCSGFAGVNMSVNNAQNALAQQLYTNQIADLERSFAAQTASTQGMTTIQSQLAQCCCDNRLATESLRATVLQENCADRYEAANNTRDIIDSQTRSTQAILDKLCALELDGYKRENDNLRTQLNMANLAASQTAQTSRILADNAAQTVALEQYLNPAPIPAYIVQNPNCCQQNACGCGTF